MGPAQSRFHNPAEQARAQRLSVAYRAAFGKRPTFVVRAPGRVNLLGEHTDYNGLPVLPMAIDRSVMIAGRARRDNRVELHNSDERFSAREFQLGEHIEPYATGDWGNYVKAAAQGLAAHLAGRASQGADLLVDGNVPAGAGLSSSSALVVAAALALQAAGQSDIAPENLATLLPGAERYVGTLSGGMDQAISLLAREGQALRIDFFPLRIRPVPVPDTCRIVVCHSLVEAKKSGPARDGYNQRVIEGRLACRVLEAALGTNLPRSLHTLGDLATFFPGRTLTDFLPHLTHVLTDGPHSLSEIAAVVGIRPDRLATDCEIPPSLPDRFCIAARVRHVLSEGERVNQGEEALRAGKLEQFGQLMDASHASCRDDYEISCSELEALVQIAKRAGALGARLTGAGFGGCTVNLVRSEALKAFLATMERDFYTPRLEPGNDVGDQCFVFRPQPGAEVTHLP